MASPTNIEWTEFNWNPLSGCSRKSKGCERCYAEKMTKRLAAMGQEKYQGLLNERDRFNGVIKFSEKDLLAPLSWKKPKKVFVNSMSDLFHETVKDEWIDKIFAVMALTPQHTYQILTKRPERMKAYLAGESTWTRIYQLIVFHFAAKANVAQIEIDTDYDKWPLPNVWLGVSVEDQKTADGRIPLLIDTPAALRWLSCEPLLGPIDFFYYGGDHGDPISFCQLRGTDATDPDIAGIDWVVVGGESGTDPRPCDLVAMRRVVDQCLAADVPVFVKQLGTRPYFDGNKAKEFPGTTVYYVDDDRTFPVLKNRKGGDPEEWPFDLRIRQFPVQAGLAVTN